MAKARLEHINVSVADPHRTARLLCDLFDWHVRWEGTAKLGGYTVHVGENDSYVAVYAYPAQLEPERVDYAGLNHIGVVVQDLEDAERRVLANGLKPYNHGDYEPGRRFYFDDDDGIEYEVVSYR